ncbi:hypothetical protein Bca52824_030212 [Brassica carinata]|uniref:Uncharacterized protein n=1 Tax=Brassica carinata TaxID=52824 RepID=A0A8X7V5D1_BRACI|nr:hypothetical protein Bca52824_030212 [Brassica carinata]
MVRIVEPKFRLSFAELLDESRVVPISVYGDLDVEITGIQQDSRGVSWEISSCAVKAAETPSWPADKRGAVGIPPRTWRLIGVTGTNENKRGRGSVGRRMDETGHYLPTEKVIQLQSSDTRERKIVLLQLGL